MESVTGAQFRETGEEVFTEEPLMFDYIAPSDEIPNHLLLLYLNLGTFLLVIGVIFALKQFNVVILCIVMIVMGSLNVIFQVIIIPNFSWVIDVIFSALKIIEFEKNEDTTSEDQDAVDQTNRVLAVVIGLLMVLGGPLLLLVCHKHNKVEPYESVADK